MGFIVRKLDISKSTASQWCRDLTLTKKQTEQLRNNSNKAGHKGRILGALANKQKKIDMVRLYKESGVAEIGKVSGRDLLIAAAALFWAEGSKTGSRFMFVNSDPQMILCVCIYLTKVAEVDASRLRITVQINKIHKPRIEKVLQFWSDFLHIPLGQFGNPYYIDMAPKKVYENYNSYYGIARLRVLGGSRLQYKLLGYIDALKAECRLPG